MQNSTYLHILSVPQTNQVSIPPTVILLQRVNSITQLFTDQITVDSACVVEAMNAILSDGELSH